MATTMKAVRFHGKEDLRFEDVPIPEMKKGHVKVKPAWVGICGTDLHEYLGGPNLCPTKPHPITGEQVPLTLGHEFSGIIQEAADDVSDYKVGDRICVQPIIYDQTCGACTSGLPNCCYSNGFIGLSGWGGGLSEYIVVPTWMLHKLPDNVPLEIGALIEPLAVGWHAVDVSPFKKGDAALVLGGGPIGLATIQALVAKGADKIIVSEISGQRKQYAKNFGAHYVFDPTKDDVVAECRKLCEGQGVHVVYDAAGVQAGLDTAVQAVRARGTVINIAVWGKPCSIMPNDWVFKERSYMGVATFVYQDFEDVLEAISKGKMQPQGMITKRIALDQVEKEGFHSLIHDKDNQVKILVEANPEITRAEKK